MAQLYRRRRPRVLKKICALRKTRDMWPAQYRAMQLSGPETFVAEYGSSEQNDGHFVYHHFVLRPLLPIINTATSSIKLKHPEQFHFSENPNLLTDWDACQKVAEAQEDENGFPAITWLQRGEGKEKGKKHDVYRVGVTTIKVSRRRAVLFKIKKSFLETRFVFAEFSEGPGDITIHQAVYAKNLASLDNTLDEYIQANDNYQTLNAPEPKYSLHFGTPFWDQRGLQTEITGFFRGVRYPR